MTELDDSVIDEAVHEGESMLLEELFDLIERSHDGEAGVDREVVVAYVRELESRGGYAFDADGFLDEIDERLTDSEEWAGAERYYELPGDRLSQYPARWHDRLGGSTDAAAYVRFLGEEAPEFVESMDRGGAGPGVPEDTLISLISIVGRVDHGAARAAIEEARERGDLVEDADQHPQAGVYLADESDPSE